MSTRSGVMKFKRGDETTHYLSIPESYWSAGGVLSFTAKPEPDNDPTDAAAIIDKSFTDSAIIDSSNEFYEEGYVTYELTFLPDDIGTITFGEGETEKRYVGEFQYVPSGGNPTTFPGDNCYITVIIYADIKLGES